MLKEPASSAASAAAPLAATPDPATVQRRTLRLLFTTQIIGGIGLATGFAVGALLAADMVGVSVSGLAQSAAVVGSALLAIPATRLVRLKGRRPSLMMLYLVASVGGLIVVGAASYGWVPLLFLGFFLFGGGTTAGLQARYAALDLAPAAARGRHLSIIVWATTVGAVTGPNLAPLAGAALRGSGIPVLAAPFLFSGVLFVVATLLLFLLMRPDPIHVARAVGRALGEASDDDERTIGMMAALRAVAAHAPARLGIGATAVGHFVMVGVMAMTPVHILGAGHDAGHTLRIVGIVLSAHTAGMFAFSPIMGWLSDRVGRRPVILGGIVVLVTACAIAGTAGHHSPQLAAGLMLLGLGWSATMVAGSTLLSESIAPRLRPSAQGLSDLTMGLAGASAGALSGIVVHAWGYPTLTLIAALAAVPLTIPTLRRA